MGWYKKSHLAETIKSKGFKLLGQTQLGLRRIVQCFLSAINQRCGYVHGKFSMRIYLRFLEYFVGYLRDNLWTNLDVEILPVGVNLGYDLQQKEAFLTEIDQ